MPTTAQITAAATTLSAVAKAQALTLVRGSVRFQSNPGLYPDLEDKLDAVTSVQAQQINAALTLLDEVGDGMVELSGGDEGVIYAQDSDRQQLVGYIIDVLYASPVLRTGVGVAPMKRLPRRNNWCSTCGVIRWNCPCP